MVRNIHWSNMADSSQIIAGGGERFGGHAA